ncbi:MAG: DNA polymerase domain-containing protein [Desulfobaccales bacterium]
MHITGWLFDLYPWQSRLVLWFITPEGEKWRVEDDFPYRIYLQGNPARLRRLGQAWESRGWVRRTYPASRLGLEGRELPVLALELRGYNHLPRLRAWLGNQKDLACYNCDLDPAAYYLYTKKVWPCAWYDLEVKDGRLLAAVPREEQFALDFSLPPLTTLSLGLAQDPLIPLGAGNTITLGWEGRTLTLEAPDPGSLVAEVAHRLKRSDPDLILSDWGDEKIIPLLWLWSQRHKVPLPLDREAGPVSREFARGRSYFSYGRIVYQGASAPCYGRWHLDRRNSFFFREAGLKGLIQAARIGQLPLQQVARASPGTLITSMQLARAVADGILIPWRKGEPERFKTAGDLLRIDKGGLVFMPPVGVHFQVAEVDFASMYPTIMTIHNISPETVNCSCCAGERVPEADYRICRRREGLVPRTLRPILLLRERLKARARRSGPEEAAQYGARQTALKWMLVTCFGYLGYKNARFGRIEAHEAVTAYGRDKLLTAKEVCEAAGFTVLHGLTDCLWIKKVGINEAELEGLCREISAATGVKLALEGIYRWIVFPASRQDPKRPVATRYFGVFQDGALKVRGLACRRRDTPPFVRQAQEALLTRLAAAATPEALAALQPELENLAADFRQRLREGRFTPQDLVITRVLSQPPEDYRVDTPTALAARQLQRAGLHLLPGEKVRYVHKEAKGPKETRIQAVPFAATLDDYDTGLYLKLLNRAIDEVLLPLSEYKSSR